MNRKEFLQRCSALGLGAYLFPGVLSGCAEDDFPNQLNVNFSGKVLIVGAGAAGITAGYVLNQYGVDFEIIEAAPIYGGRVKEASGFADFPIDLGAEWIHTDPSILAELINDPSQNANIEIINYSPETLYIWKDDKLRKRNFFTNFYGEHKFKNTTWYSFFDRYMIPAIQDKISLNSPVESIDYSGNQVTIRTTNNQTFQGDRAIVTVPLTILKENRIDFQPALPTSKISALSDVQMPDGIKVFIEFRERFYPDLLVTGGIFDFLQDDAGEKLYYDAAFGKDSSRNVLGLFTVGEKATTYSSIPTDSELIQFMLNELDEIFDGAASRNYIQHVAQNWSQEPYIGGSYSQYDDESRRSDLMASIDNKLYFAGETYADSDYATVHGAGQSAYRVVEEILRG